MAVALACGDRTPAITDSAAVAIELFHCASLVHDDLPCFDDAAFRRGLPSVHAAFGEGLAVLAGDALIVLAFQALLHPNSDVSNTSLPSLLAILCRATGMPTGIVAGQAWEFEPTVRLSEYERAKTGALFAASTEAGAVAAGCDPAPWRSLGDRLGEAYQVADDIRDAAANPAELGKPVGQDLAHDRPSVARELGLKGALKRFDHLIQAATDSIPDCPGADSFKAIIGEECRRLIPTELARLAA